MNIEKSHSDSTVLAEIGSRLARARLAKNLTQAEFAAQAGISKRTLERLESGNVATRLTAFIRVCRELGILEQINAFIPEPPLSPIAQLKFKGRQRQRASGSRESKLATDQQTPFQNEKTDTWQWGDES